MRKLYMINYDLNRPVQDYTDLINEIKKSPNWAKYLKSGWFIVTTETADQIYQRLAKWLDSDDAILINEFTPNHFGVLDKQIWEWLKKYNF